MLLERRALEVSRLCIDPGEDVAAVACHVFIDAQARVTATDGRCLLRVDATPQQKPDLFMQETIGHDEACEAITLPADVVTDFLRAWSGDHVVVRRENGSSAALASADGETSRLFEVKQGTLDPPKFESMLAPKPAMASITISVDLLKKLALTLKALKVPAITLHIADGPHPESAAIRLTAKVLGRDVLEGALMPMRMPDEN